jgi:chitin synthase
LQYCSAASNDTSCPVIFNEFFKQRRRWIQSTLANQILLLQEWRSVVSKGMSIFFMLYQAVLLFTTLISPALLIMIIVGTDFSLDWEVKAS